MFWRESTLSWIKTISKIACNKSYVVQPLSSIIQATEKEYYLTILR